MAPLGVRTAPASGVRATTRKPASLFSRWRLPWHVAHVLQLDARLGAANVGKCGVVVHRVRMSASEQPT